MIKLIGDFIRILSIQYNSAQENIRPIIIVVNITTLISIGQDATLIVFGITFIVWNPVFSDLYGTDIDREIEADCFGSCETQEVCHLLCLTGSAAGGNPFAHIGKGDGGHDGGNSDHDQQFD